MVNNSRDLDVNMINKELKIFDELLNIDCLITVNIGHILKRIADRSLDALDIVKALQYARAGKFAEMFRNMFTDQSSNRPFNVEFKTRDIILVWTRRNDDWCLTTVLDPRIHSLHEDEKADSTFFMRINHV